MSTNSQAVRTCAVCGEALEPMQLGTTEHFVRCPCCTLIVRHDLSPDVTAEIYESDAYAHGDWSLQHTDARRVRDLIRAAASRIQWVKQAKEQGTLLDVGAAGGAFVKAASEAGFVAMGVEPTPAFAEFARSEVGVDVRTGTLQEAALGPDPFDCISMWHVLEHIPDPLAHATDVYARLAEGGVLALEVPNIDSVMARELGPAWPGLHPDVHVNQFTPTSLERLLAAAGFTDIRLTTVSHGIYLTPFERLTSPRYLAHRIKLRRGGAHGIAAPHGHEYLRALARRT